MNLTKYYVQINALDSCFCGLEPKGVPCPHKWATVRLCDELSHPNNCKFATMINLSSFFGK